MAETAYDRIKSMNKPGLAIFLRNIYLMGVLDERRNGALGSIDFFCDIPSCHYDNLHYPSVLHEYISLYSIVHTTPYGSCTFGVFKSWDDAFEYISTNHRYTLDRIDTDTFRDGVYTYQIIKL